MIFTAENVGKELTIKAYLDNAENPHPKFLTTAHICNACLRVHEVQQEDEDKTLEPPVCKECGGKTFTILPNESTYTDIQTLHFLLHDETYFRVILHGKQCSYKDYETGMYTIKGTLRVNIQAKPFRYYLDQVTEIRRKK